MYAHQVIEDLKVMRERTDLVDPKKIDFVIQNIRDAQHFHFGMAESIRDIINVNEGDIIFQGDQQKYIDPPYKKCWFDFDLTDNQCPQGAYYIELLENDILLGLRFAKDQRIGTWVPAIGGFLISLNDDSNIDKELRGGKMRFVWEETTIWKKLIELDEPTLKNQIQYESTFYDILNLCLMLLNCKNISTEDQPAPARLNKKRAKTGKQPLFSYKTLNISLPSKKRGASGSTVSMSDPKRLHLCRGHFKTYTEENPLFGQHVGRYFWQPTLRGDKKAGLVMKDYNIRTSK